MTEPYVRLPLVAVERIDAACDRFEAQWRAGYRPRIEDFLMTITDRVEYAGLLGALVEVEAELRRSAGEDLAQEEYMSRFPNHADVVISAFRKSDRRISQDSTGVPEAAAPRGSQVSVETQWPAGASVREDVPPHARIGRFAVLELLGEGAFGRVYRARDPQLERDVAIKLPRPNVGGPAEIERFLREARAAANVRHANVCPVHEVGTDRDQTYIVMAYVAGPSLAAWLAKSKEPPAAQETARIVRQIALGLEAAHAKGVVHRDLKPSNVLLDPESHEAVVTDFGLARILDDARRTREGSVLGTPAYMAPEQARGDLARIGPASDIYSLGVILYEMLTGQLPFTGSAYAVLLKVEHDEPAPPSQVRPTVDTRLEAICLKAMARDASARYTTMQAFADALAEYLDAAPAPAPDTMTTVQLPPRIAAIPPLWRPVRSWRVAAASAAVLSVAAIIFFTKSPTGTEVQVRLPVDTKDPGLSYSINGEARTADFFAAPVALKVGKYDLVVKRGDKTEQHIRIEVTGGKEPGFTLTEVPQSPALPADNWAKEREAAEWVLQHSGQLLVKSPTGNVMGHIQKREELPAGQWTIMLVTMPGIDNGWKQEDLHHLKGLADLQHLDLANGSGFAEATFDLIADIKSLQGVALLGKVNWTPAMLNKLASLPKLYRLDIRGAGFTDAHCAELPKLKALTDLFFDTADITDRGWADVARLPGLQKLFLFQRVHIGSAGLKALGGTRIDMLEIDGITDDGLEQLKGLATLGHLTLENTKLTDAGLKPLTGFTSLNYLRIAGAAFRGDGLAALSGMKKLNALDLTNCKVEDAGLVHLAPLTSLTTLWLHNSLATDNGLKHLTGLARLDRLDLAGSAVTDDGLKHLANLKKLNQLDLRGTKVTADGVKLLREALPKCAIQTSLP